MCTFNTATVTTENSRWQARQREIEFKDLMNEIIPEVSSKWIKIGVQLKLSLSLLKRIESDNPKDAELCCMEMFHEWLSQDTEASWPTLVVALDSNSVAEHKLAQTLRTHF